MSTATAIIRSIERIAPLYAAADWDVSGVQVAGEAESVSKLALGLDPTPFFVAQALDWGAEFVLTHHPLAMKPRLLNRLDRYHQVVSRLMKGGAWLYAAHTSLDAQWRGPAGWLAREMGLDEVDILEPSAKLTPIGIHFHLGVDQQHILEEWKSLDLVLDLQTPNEEEVLMVCFDRDWPELKSRISCDIEACPAFMRMDLALPDRTLGFGFVGDLPGPMERDAFTQALMQALGRGWWTASGTELPETISRVAYCTGSGAGLADKAFASGADVFITGDVKYHFALEAEGPILDVGHFILEEEMTRRLADELSEGDGDDWPEVRFFPSVEPMALYHS